MASSSSHSIIEVPAEDGNSGHKLQLQQAIRRNDWKLLEEVLEKIPTAQTEPITGTGETVLILVAKQGKKSNLLLRRLMGMMPDEALTGRDGIGETALHAAARVGNVVGARILVSKNPDLANISNVYGNLPLHIAAFHAHRDVLLFLLNMETDNVQPNPFAGQPDAKLVFFLTTSRLYDIALLLIQRYPMLARDPNISPLIALAQEPTAFQSGVKLGFWKRLIYTGFLGVKENSPTPNFMQQNKQDPEFVPQLKNIRRTKVLHLQAMELLRCSCEGVMRLSSDQALLIFSHSLHLAAQYGISEVVEEILKSFPNVINYVHEDKRSALHLAVMYRHDNVFNAIYGLIGESFGFVSTFVDSKGNNMLHLAGYRAKQYQLDLVSSAVLQIQRELQWFQEVERLMPPHRKKHKNDDGMTPLEVFQKEHKEMEVYERHGKFMCSCNNNHWYNSICSSHHSTGR